MHIVSKVSRISCFFRSHLIRRVLLIFPDAFVANDDRLFNHQCCSCSSFSRELHFTGSFDHPYAKRLSEWRLGPRNPTLPTGARACIATAVVQDDLEECPTDAVKELYDKMVQSVDARTMPPNAWLWSLLESCRNHGDIKLLFDILHTLRKFRLSNLRIHANFNCNLCREITRACVRTGAIDFGKKTLWKHNVYGLTPSIASAHFLLLHAKENNNTELVEEIMMLIQRNDLPLQPGIADIVFSICYDADDWNLMSVYSKKFLLNGVKLRQATFGTWMQFAAKRGDTRRLWKIEKLRSDTMKHHTLASGFSCAKGYLLEHKPEDAASLIVQLHQNLSDAKKPSVITELENLVNKWPLDVVKCWKKDNRKTSATALGSDISAMITILSEMDLRVDIAAKDFSSMISC